VFQAGAPWTTITSVSGTPTVVASVIGTVAANVSQTTSPWITQAGSSGVFLGYVVASVLGGGTTVASVIGQVTVTASIAGTVPIQGTVTANQGAPPWQWVGSAHVTQAGSPWYSQLASGGQFVGYVVASVVGGAAQTSVWVVNTVSVLQAGSPWNWVGSAVVQGSVQATVQGSVLASQGGSPWTWTGSALVQGQVANDAVYAGNPLGAGALALDYAQSSYTHVGCGDMVAVIADRMGRLRVAVDTGTVALTGQVFTTTSVIGFPTVIASVSGQLFTTTSVAGTVPVQGTLAVTQTSSPWVVTGSVQATLAAGGLSVVGSVWVTNTPSVLQAGAPWSWVGSAVVQGSVQATVAGSVHATTVGSVLASQGAAPWQWVGSAQVTQASSPWVTQAGSSGQFQGFVVASVIGNPTVIASVSGQLTATASVVGQVAVTASVSGFPTVIASVSGQLFATTSVIGNPTVIASISGNIPVTQVTSPWVTFASSIAFTVPQGAMVGSVTVVGSVFASVVGSVVVVPPSSPFTYAKIAWEVQSTLPYPYDGTGICRSVSATTTVLASDVMSSDVTGLRLMIVSSGVALGQSVALTGWATQASQQVAHAAWTVTPASGQQYVLLLDAKDRTNVQVRTEIASNTARVYYAFGLWAAVQSGNLGLSTLFPQNYPKPVFDTLQAVDPLPTSFGIAVASYWPAEAKQVACTGYTGVKLYVTSATARFSLWGATT
jgi:hypothetical protein